jgi:lysophospholipase L1-like esterase
MRLLALAAALLLLSAPARADDAQWDLDDSDSGSRRPLSEYLFDATGAPWPIAGATLQCSGEGFAGGASWACDGATLTKSGTPQSVDAPLWPNGFASAAAKAVAFNGSTDYFSFDASAPAGSFYECADFVTDTVAASDSVLVGKDNFSTKRTFVASRWAGTLIFRVSKSNASSSSVSRVLVAGESNIACWVYEWVADGTSKIRMVMNEQAPVEISNAVGPPQVADQPWLIGTATSDYAFWDGAVGSIVHVDGAAPSNADLQRIVRARRGQQGTGGETVTVTGSATRVEANGAEWVVPANSLAVGPEGAIGEPAKTQYLLDNCLAPASQAVSLTAGTYVAWVAGTGSMALAVGTATATGLPCTAIATRPCRFTVTAEGAGTVAATVTGTLTHQAIESGWFQTSKICCAGTSCNRAAGHQIALTSPASARPWCIAVAYTPPPFASYSAPCVQRYLWTLGSWQGPNSADIQFGGCDDKHIYFAVRDSAGTAKNLYPGHDLVPGSRLDLLACVDGSGAQSLWVNGTLFNASNSPTSGTGTNVFASFPATLYLLGRDSTSGQAGGSAKEVRICESEAQCRLSVEAGLNPRAVTALGDSITAGGGGTTAYPNRLAESLPFPWHVHNDGVGGNTSAQMGARWTAGINRAGYGVLVMLGGINDVYSDVPATTIWANQKAVLDDAVARGLRTILLTTLPFGSAAGAWNEARQAQLDALLALQAAYTGGPVIDANAAIRDPDHPLNILPAYDLGDGIHLNNTGQAVLAGLVEAALLAE